MKPTKSSNVAGYGLHYYACNQLIPNTSDRALLQTLIDMVRKPLSVSLDNQTVSFSQRKLGRMAGLEPNRTIPSCLAKLECLGLIKRNGKLITIRCDELVTAIKHYETLPEEDKKAFADEFANKGVQALDEQSIEIEKECRCELLGMTGSSIKLPEALDSHQHQNAATLQRSSDPNTAKMQYSPENAVKMQCFSENTAKIQHFENPNTAKIQHSSENTAKIQHFEDPNTVKMQYSPENTAKMQCFSENAVKMQYSENENAVFLQHFGDVVAKMLYLCSTFMRYEELIEGLDTAKMQHLDLEFIQAAFLTGKTPENWLQKCCIFAVSSSVFLQYLASKMLYFYSTVIIEKNKIKKINERKQAKAGKKSGSEGAEGEGSGDFFGEGFGGGFKKGFEDFLGEGFKEGSAEDSGAGSEEEGDENSQEPTKDIFDKFRRVDVLDLPSPSDSLKEKDREMDRLREEQKRLSAMKTSRNKNPYRNKPFIPMERFSYITEVLEEVVQSPVDFFIYNFWWGLFDLYGEHYHPSVKYDEDENPMDDFQDSDWQEMIGATLPQDEVCSLAKNVYEDLEGAVEQGGFSWLDTQGNEHSCRMGFKDFKGFDPFRVFQFDSCIMSDRHTPGFIVSAKDSFRDIEAEDIHEPSETVTKQDKAFQAAVNETFIKAVLEAEDKDLSPLEAMIRDFYGTFASLVEGEAMLDHFTDEQGVSMAKGVLPDFKIRPWCVGKQASYEDFTEALATKYLPCNGIRKRAFLFSAEKVVRWNEGKYLRDTIAHKAVSACRAPQASEESEESEDSEETAS